MIVTLSAVGKVREAFKKMAENRRQKVVNK